MHFNSNRRPYLWMSKTPSFELWLAQASCAAYMALLSCNGTSRTAYSPLLAGPRSPPGATRLRESETLNVAVYAAPDTFIVADRRQPFRTGSRSSKQQCIPSETRHCLMAVGLDTTIRSRAPTLRR